MTLKLLAAALLFALCAPSWAAEPPTEGDDPGKFFVFHLPDVPVLTARADLNHCVDMAKDILSMQDRTGNSNGLLGALIGGRMASIDRLRMRNAVLRKCMGLQGYDRYAMPQAAWKAMVNDGDMVLDNQDAVSTTVIARLSKIAAGPQPTGERLPR